MHGTEEQSIKVSVVMPVYNTQEYLGECMDSVLRSEEHTSELQSQR